jgi:hypothetical protein
MATLTADVGASDVLWHVSARIPQSVPFLEAGSEVVAILGWSMPGVGGHDDPLRIWVQRGVAGTTPAAHLSAASLTPIYSLVGTPQLNAGGGGSAVTIAATDPGALGAGTQWINTAQDDQQSFGAFPLFVRNATNDGWIQAGFANAVGDVNIDSWSQDGNIDAFSDHNGANVSPTASIGIVDYRAPRHSVALGFGNDAGQVYDRVELLSQNTDTLKVQLVILRVDPSAAAGIKADIGAPGFRNNSGTGELWFKTGAADTAWSKVTIP